MMDTTKATGDAQSLTSWTRVRMWILHVLELSVIEVSEGTYVGSI